MFRNHKWEFICLSCGAAFRIIESTRKQDANRLMAYERKQRVPTNGKTADRDAMAQYRAACKRQFKVFKHAREYETRRLVGEQMREWLDTGEGARLREHLNIPSGAARG